jgi:hypothetical protein
MPTYSRTASAFQVASKTGGGTSWTNEGNVIRLFSLLCRNKYYTFPE